MLPERFDRKVEEKWQKLWEERKPCQFDEKDAKKPIYSIDSPPPFTSGDLHMGHVLSYCYFDFAARYKRMRGYNVFYPQGWDCQGFPTEVKVEAKYGRLPPEQFREKCVEWTASSIERMRAQMETMGFSPDWRYEYKTMSPDYHRRVQYSLLKMHEGGLVYCREHPVFWCPNCKSAIAKTDTEEVERETMLSDIEFGLEEKKEAVNETKKTKSRPKSKAAVMEKAKGMEAGMQKTASGKLLIATTRPELLHACVAVLFNPSDRRYKKLEGKHAITPIGGRVPILPDKDVDKEFGTGLVMVCTFGDKQDVIWMYRHKLGKIAAMDESGRMRNSGGLYDGLRSEEARGKILEKLKGEGKLHGQKPLSQVVKVHDRCKRQIELIDSKQWFCKIKGLEEKIVEAAKEIKWIPEFGISYLIDWAGYVEWDWVISRQRVFGTPIPFWHCKACNSVIAAEYGELPVTPALSKKKCPKCGADAEPELSTCDCWIDSSITPLVIAGWPDSKEWKRFYPASLRPQGVEIVRTWAFYTIYRCKMLTGIAPFGEILLNGNVLAPDGKKMSKSLGNIIAPDKLIEDYSADAVRQWAALSGAMAKDRPFSYQDMSFAKAFNNKLWNAAKFVLLARSKVGHAENHELRAADRWILSRLNSLIESCTKEMDGYNYHPVITQIQQFFHHEFCDYYLEYVKWRVYDNPGTKMARGALQTLEQVMEKTLLLLAPIAPHITEELYSEMFGKGHGSIHREEWPKSDPSMVDRALDEVAFVANQATSLLCKERTSRYLVAKGMLGTVEIRAPAEISDFREEIESAGKVGRLLISKGEFSVSVV